MISNAFAQAASGAAPESSFLSLLPLVILFIIMYFIAIRPQMKRQKEHKALIEGLQKGDEVVAGGMAGRIVKLNDAYVVIEIPQVSGQSVELTVQRPTVQVVLPKGSLKDLV